MDLESTQESIRRSSRKRLRTTDSRDVVATDNETRSEIHAVSPRKRRVVEKSDICESTRDTGVIRSAVQLRGSSTSAQATSQQSATVTAHSHDDPVPVDCCVVCRRRGGNYAYTCIYDENSYACKRCLKEKYKCRAATAEEIAKSEARCPQCKQRGLNTCWYESGNSMCEPCIKWGKQCGAPTRRKLNANTRSFLGLNTPEPERPADATTRPATVNNSTSSTSASISAPISSSPRPLPTTLPSQSRTSSRRGAAKSTIVSVGTTLDRSSLPDILPQPGQDRPRHEIRTRTRLSQVQSIGDGRNDNRVSKAQDAELINSVLLGGSRRTSTWKKGLTSHAIMQEATPEDSADDEALPLPANVNIGDDESADLQLTLENQMAKSTFITNETRLHDNSQLSSRSVLSGEERLTRQRDHVAVVIPQASRSCRSHGQLSYVEYTLSDTSDKEVESDSGEGEDAAWDPSDVDNETEGNKDEEEDEDSGMLLDSSSDEAGDDEDVELDDVEPKVASVSRRKSQSNSNSTPKQGKGIDLNLPPLENIRDIVADMATEAVGLGLYDALRNLNERPINVATMCSGTESPLVFLNMLDEALRSKGMKGLPVNHHFSAEIDATKQAFIERNFHPPVLFRDVRQLGDEAATTATTAYGAEERIPGNLNILIAGFVCKDLSSLNSKKKTVDDQGETGDTWRAIYYYTKRFQPSIVLLENVRSEKKVWDDVVSRWSKIGYEAAWVYCDTKNYYIPQTRERMYMIAINREMYGKSASKAVAAWQSTMEKLKRQCSSPYEAFLTDLPTHMVAHSILSSESDWSLCKLRYDQIRSEQQLGGRRPITQWSESGTLHPPDYANRKWYDSQSSRVYDAIDVAHLQAAQEGHDSMYKMKIWDVSQNVDRFKTGLGLVPCITPGGCDFASNLQDALNGSQTLVLQGMLIGKLHFAGETQRECQDLAGNAMSTTVIGASLISAIIHGYRAFRSDPSASNRDATSQINSQTQSSLVRAAAMQEHNYQPAAPDSLPVAQLLTEAKFTSRLCACEGDQVLSESDIKICSACGHTACATCASNPRHQYAASIQSNVRNQTPDQFERSWRQRLPARLKLEESPFLKDRLSKMGKRHENHNAYFRTIAEANFDSQQFSLSDFLRCDNEWKIVYVGKGARMVLSVGDEAQWLLFVDCSRKEPSNSALRKALETPIARATIDNSLLSAMWEIFDPNEQEHLLHAHGSAERNKSWRNTLGLPNYQAETVPTQIHIRGNDEEINFLRGDYKYLPHCGTAEASLYKRSAEPVLYLFLDPNLIGEARDDRFVFSQDSKRKKWGQTRTNVTRLKSGWRPWHMGKENEQHSITVVRTGSWSTVPMRLVSSSLAPTASVLMSGISLTGPEARCTSALTILDARIPEELPVDRFSDFSWILQQVRTAPRLEGWQPVDVLSQGECTCAPTYPRFLWSVDKAGKAMPHEDRKAAAIFERGVKTRCPIFHVQPMVSANQTRIQVGINLASLLHRAKGRLSRLVDSAQAFSHGWRLMTDHADGGYMRLHAFRLRSNAVDSPYLGPLNLEYELRGAQPRALAWMRAQEDGVPLMITEVEEAVYPDLGWRVEARADATIEVRGGVLADLPSFGKTVTTIALIQSEFEESSPTEIIEQNQSATQQSLRLIDTAATLIVCPPHITLQWQTELQTFLGESQYKAFDVCIIKDFAELKRLTINDLQQSRVIVVSWTVFSDDDYTSELAWVTAMPEPANSSCRAFSAWMDGVSEGLPAQVSNLSRSDLSDFKSMTQDLLEKRLQKPEFQAMLPLRLQHGSNYQSYEAMRAAGGQKTNGKSKAPPKRKSSGSRSQIIPLLHLFQFNRIVVDEYHYLNDHKKLGNTFAATSVKKIAAHKRWILSGTPALANFTDIDNIASFLGIQLGRFAMGAGRRTALEDFLISDQTAVECFLSKTEVMSHQWHQARHQRAQEFLDLFVRQNEASLEHIPCQEELRAIELDVAHHAVYFELSQHLISQRMQVKRLRNKADSDRTSRLNASLNNSKTAEDALLKAALLYETGEEDSGLDTLVQKRSQQRQETEDEILRLMRAFEWHKNRGFKGLKPTDPKKAELEENTVPKLYTSFTQDIHKNAWLGDFEATMKARQLLESAARCPSSGGFEELRGISKEKMIREAKTIMSHLRQTCVELALRSRSERFITTVQQLLQPLCDGSQEPISCDANTCQGKASVSEMYLASQCGHLTCQFCMLARGNDENCIASGCSCTVQAVNLIKATDLGSTREVATTHSYGRKMNSIAELIKRFPGDDQGLVFAPNDEMAAMLGEVLDDCDIRYCTPVGCNSRQAAKVIEEFKSSANEDIEDRSKVLLLNLNSETAAGVNLTNANHIIFISPLLVESQYKYDSAMTQAIARSRRYGQEKQVHIYHFAALRTIDVDILEHRHKRTNGITAARSNMRMPSNALEAREKTKLVKNSQGSVALVPISWLADEKVRKDLGVEEEPEKFTSLINFSETFQDGEE